MELVLMVFVVNEVIQEGVELVLVVFVVDDVK